MHTFIQITGEKLQLFNAYTLPLHFPVLIALLLAATMIDVRERRIPNRLVGFGMIIGILFHATAPQGAGAWFAVSGLGIGIVTLFPLFALGFLGAGDVKLVGMIGAFLGMADIFGVILASMAAGGVLALGMAAGKRMLPQLLVNVRLMLVQRHIRQMSGAAAGAVPDPPSVGKMPYALAICTGTLVQLFFLS